MSICTAAPSNVVNSPQLAPEWQKCQFSILTRLESLSATSRHKARIVGSKQRGKADLGSVCYQFHPLVARSGQVQSVRLEPVQNVKLEPIERGTCFAFAGTRKAVTHSTLRQSSAFICAAALNARCSAEQTQTVTRQAPTMTHIPAKDKLPDLDDGGTGFPPRDDGDGGGGGGGGGGNWSGGFFFFGFLLFLGFLKDKESEEPYRDERRR